MRTFSIVTFLLLLVIAVSAAGQNAPDPIRIGFFQGGQYAQFDVFRDIFRQQLKALLPDEYMTVFPATGFRSAEWNRDTCKAMAAKLAGRQDLDLVVALGPWTAEDLLSAGFNRPIIAAGRFDPRWEGLVDGSGRPIAENLTVRISPDRVEQDLRLLADLTAVRKLGFLYFPSGSEADSVVAEVARIGSRNGVEVITASGLDNVGTYAFFKAYQNLDRDVDAMYVSSLFGFDGNKTKAFFEMAFRDKKPVMSFDGRYQVVRGALVGTVSEAMIGVARYTADKVVKIIEGAVPADLPTEYVRQAFLTINEATARRCRVEIPENILLASDIIAAPPSDEVDYFDLSSAITQALMANPGYLARHDALEAAEKWIGQARSEYLPQVRAMGQAFYFDDNTVDNSRGLISNERYRADLTLSQMLFSLSTISSVRLAGLLRDAEGALVDSATVAYEKAVTTAYLNLLKADVVRITLSDHRLLIDRLLELAGSRYDLGETDAADMYRWQYERQRMTRLMVEADRNLNNARILLNLLLGRPGDMQLRLDHEVGSEARFVRDYLQLQPRFAGRREMQRSTGLIIDKALEISPKLQYAARHVDIAQNRLNHNRYRYFPTVGIKARLSWQDELQDSPPLFSEKSSTWGIGAWLQLPLFEGGDRIHAGSRLKAQFSLAQYQADNAMLLTRGRVGTAVQDLKAALTNTPIAAQGEEQVRLYLEAVADSYSAGDRTLAEMIDAVATSLVGRLDAIGTRFDYFEAAARLVYEVGWSVRGKKITPGDLLAQILSEGTAETSP